MRQRNINTRLMSKAKEEAMTFNLMGKWKEAKKRADAIVQGDVVPIVPEEKPKQVYRPKRYNIHKRSLPVGIDKIVVYNVESYTAAVQLIAKAMDKFGQARLFQEKVFYNDDTRTKTVIYYEPVAVDASPIERSVFYNTPDTKNIDWKG
jgi:hypothetical protein